MTKAGLHKPGLCVFGPHLVPALPDLVVLPLILRAGALAPPSPSGTRGSPIFACGASCRPKAKVTPTTISAGISSSPTTGRASGRPAFLASISPKMAKRTEATLVQLVRPALTGWLRGAARKTWHAAGTGKLRCRRHWPPHPPASGYTGCRSPPASCSSAAAVTSARHGVTSPEYGLVAKGALAAGLLLVKIESAELESELALVAAELDPDVAAPPDAVQLRGGSTDPSGTAAAAASGTRARLLALERRRRAPQSRLAPC